MSYLSDFSRNIYKNLYKFPQVKLKKNLMASSVEYSVLAHTMELPAQAVAVRLWKVHMSRNAAVAARKVVARKRRVHMGVHWCVCWRSCSKPSATPAQHMAHLLAPFSFASTNDLRLLRCPSYDHKLSHADNDRVERLGPAGSAPALFGGRAEQSPHDTTAAKGEPLPSTVVVSHSEPPPLAHVTATLEPRAVTRREVADEFASCSHM